MPSITPVDDNNAALSTAAPSTLADTEAEVHRDCDAEGQFRPVDDNQVAVVALECTEVGADIVVCSRQKDEVVMKSCRKRRGDPALWKKCG